MIVPYQLLTFIRVGFKYSGILHVYIDILISKQKESHKNDHLL